MLLLLEILRYQKKKRDGFPEEVGNTTVGRGVVDQRSVSIRYDRYVGLTELISVKSDNCGPIISTAYGHYGGAISAAHQSISMTISWISAAEISSNSIHFDAYR